MYPGKLVTALFLSTNCTAVPFALVRTCHQDDAAAEVSAQQANIAARTVDEALAVPSTDEAAPGRRSLESAAAKTRDAQRLELAARVDVAHPEAQRGSTRRDGAAVQAVKRSVTHMTAAQGLYNAEASRKHAIDEILASSQKLLVFEDALKDEGYAKSTFGSFQAETSYFASLALQRAARDGNEEPLIRTVKALSGVAANGLSAGQKQDFEELLLGWARLKETGFFESATGALPASLNYNGALPEEVRALYKDSVYLALYPRVGTDRARHTVDRLFPS